MILIYLKQNMFFQLSFYKHRRFIVKNKVGAGVQNTLLVIFVLYIFRTGAQLLQYVSPVMASCF